MKFRRIITTSGVFIVSFLLVIQAFCQGEKPENIEIRIRKVNSTSFSELVKRITLLPIEYRPDALIQRIGKIEVAGDKFYILNNLKTFDQNLIIAGPDGSILQVLNQKGKGPGEYQAIHDFSVDPVDQSLWIYDGIRQVFSIYSPELKFLRNYKGGKDLSSGCFCFAPWNIQKILVNNSAPEKSTGKLFQLILADREGNKIEQFLESDNYQFTTGGYYRLQRLREAVDYWPPYSGEILRFKDDRCYPVYQVSFDEPVIKPETMITSSMHPEIFNQTFYESDSYLLIECMISNKPYLTFYNKDTRQITTIQNPWNTQTDEGFLYSTPGFINNNLVFDAIALDLKELVAKLDPNGTKIVNKEVLNKIDPESPTTNPILVFVELW